MKTIKDFQNENELCLEKDSMSSINGGLASTSRRETYCTGANGGDSEITYVSDSGALISCEGFTEDGTHYKYP